jgi:MFS transporter, FHS family, glucose/mannose:H+ symporter
MLILSGILAFFVYGVIASAWGTLNPTLGFTDAQNGTIALAQALGLVVSSLAAGPLVDTKGKKTALLLGFGLIGVALVLLPNAHRDYALVIACLSLLGLGGGTIVTAANTLASDVNESRRATMLNLLNLFFGLGGLLTPFATANLLGGDAIRMCYVGAVLTLIAIVVTVLAPMPIPTGERGFKASEIGVVLGRPVLYFLALFLFLYISCEVGVWNWLAKYLEASRGIPHGQALNILSLGFALGLLLGRLAISRVLIDVASVTVTLVSSGLMAVTTYLMLQTSSPLWAWIAVFCTGLAMAPVFPTTLAMVGDAFPRMTATALGLVITSGWIGLAVSSRIIGSVADSYSLGSALLLLPAFSVVMIVVNLAMRPMLRSAVKAAAGA